MARTELCHDKPFDPSHSLNILIKLKASDTGLSNTLTMPKEFVEKNLFPWFSKHRRVKLSQHDSVQLLDLYEYDSKITTTLIMKKEQDGNFKFHGWSNILDKRKFKTGDIIGFWWDKFYDRLNFISLSTA
ncbi:putative transcription factor B3-Domain family [Arabidopsis thaliana]